MVLCFLGESETATMDLMQAIEATTADKVLTPDLQGRAHTTEFTGAVLTSFNCYF